MMTAISSLSPICIFLLISLYLVPRHDLPVSLGTLYFMQSYLKLELSQIQQSSVQILGITGVCTGIAERSLVKCSVANQSRLALAGELQVIIIQP